MNLEQAVFYDLVRVVIAPIGPSTSERLRLRARQAGYIFEVFPFHVVFENKRVGERTSQ
jgi:hypothetical protein